jgi:phage-related tail protein
MEENYMNIFAKVFKVIKITKNLLSDKTESEIKELSVHVQQAAKEAGDVMDAAKGLGQETEELFDETTIILTLATAILQRFWGQPDADSRRLYPADVEQFIEQGVNQL